MINPPIQTMENIIIKITPLFSIFFCKDKTKPKIRQKSKGPQKSHSNNFESVDAIGNKAIFDFWRMLLNSLLRDSLFFSFNV